MEIKEKIKSKRLLIDVDPEFHAEIKRRALFKNISLRKWIMRAIMDQVKKEKQYE